MLIEFDEFRWDHHFSGKPVAAAAAALIGKSLRENLKAQFRHKAVDRNTAVQRVEDVLRNSFQGLGELTGPLLWEKWVANFLLRGFRYHPPLYLPKSSDAASPFRKAVSTWSPDDFTNAGSYVLDRVQIASSATDTGPANNAAIDFKAPKILLEIIRSRTRSEAGFVEPLDAVVRYVQGLMTDYRYDPVKSPTGEEIISRDLVAPCLLKRAGRRLTSAIKWHGVRTRFASGAHFVRPAACEIARMDRTPEEQNEVHSYFLSIFDHLLNDLLRFARNRGYEVNENDEGLAEIEFDADGRILFIPNRLTKGDLAKGLQKSLERHHQKRTCRFDPDRGPIEAYYCGPRNSFFILEELKRERRAVAAKLAKFEEPMQGDVLAGGGKLETALAGQSAVMEQSRRSLSPALAFTIAALLEERLVRALVIAFRQNECENALATAKAKGKFCGDLKDATLTDLLTAIDDANEADACENHSPDLAAREAHCAGAREALRTAIDALWNRKATRRCYRVFEREYMANWPEGKELPTRESLRQSLRRTRVALDFLICIWKTSFTPELWPAVGRALDILGLSDGACWNVKEYMARILRKTGISVTSDWTLQPTTTMSPVNLSNEHPWKDKALAGWWNYIHEVLFKGEASSVIQSLLPGSEVTESGIARAWEAARSLHGREKAFQHAWDLYYHGVAQMPIERPDPAAMFLLKEVDGPVRPCLTLDEIINAIAMFAPGTAESVVWQSLLFTALSEPEARKVSNVFDVTKQAPTLSAELSRKAVTMAGVVLKCITSPGRRAARTGIVREKEAEVRQHLNQLLPLDDWMNPDNMVRKLILDARQRHALLEALERLRQKIKRKDHE